MDNKPTIPTAQLLQFPVRAVRTRNSGPWPDGEASVSCLRVSRAERSPVRNSVAVCGAWYHEAAVLEAEREAELAPKH